MANKKHHPFGNLLIPIAILLLGISAWEYYERREITWYKDPVSAFNEILLELQSMTGTDEVAPFVVERSQPSDTIRTARADSREEARDPAAIEIDPRFVEPGESRFELVGRVSRVADGDSLEVRVDGSEYSIRLYGIDSPEGDQPYGRDASRALARKLNRRTVLINVVDIDSYGRLVGIVYHEGENINLTMIAEGHSWWYRRYAESEDHFEDAEKAARQARSGLWSDTDPVAPWDWRRAN